MNKTLLLLLLFLLCETIAAASSRYQKECDLLVHVTFNLPIDFIRIERQIQIVESVIRQASISNVRECNCADSVWIESVNQGRRYVSYTHFSGIDTNNYIRDIPTRLDEALLYKELAMMNFFSGTDTLQYLFRRKEKKIARKELKPNNWRTFFWTFDAEYNFFRRHKYKMAESYIAYISNSDNSVEERDELISCYYYSSPLIADRFVALLAKHQDSEVYQQMTRVVAHSGNLTNVIDLVRIIQSGSTNDIQNIALVKAAYRILDHEDAGLYARLRLCRCIKSKGLEAIMAEKSISGKQYCN